VGQRSLVHLGTELLKSAAGIDLLHVPFQGTAPGVTALISGNVDLMIVPAGTAEQQRKAGKLKILAIAGPARYPVIADVPTTAETGYPAVVVQQWFGLVVPKGGQNGITDRPAAAFSSALAHKENRRLDRGSGRRAAAHQWRTVQGLRTGRVDALAQGDQRRSHPTPVILSSPLAPPGAPVADRRRATGWRCCHAAQGASPVPR
jgi:hypothetical protein